MTQVHPGEEQEGKDSIGLFQPKHNWAPRLKGWTSREQSKNTQPQWAEQLQALPAQNTMHISIRKNSGITYFSVQMSSELCKSVQLGQAPLDSAVTSAHCYGQDTQDVLPVQNFKVPELI